MQQLNTIINKVMATARHAMPLLLNRRAVWIAVLFWVPVIAFVSVAEEVSEGDTLAYDRAVLQFINAHLSSPQLDPYVVAFTNLGSAIGVAVITAAAILLLLATGRRRAAAYVTAVVGGASAMNALLKLLFARDRPTLFETLVLENSYSFPSGHAMVSSAMAFAAIVLAWRTRYRIPVIIAATVYFVAMSFTRLYLGVHYPTDVIAGWLISAAWVTAMYFALRMDKFRRPTSAR